MPKLSNNEVVNNEIQVIDDQRRRLGIASLHGKIKTSIQLLQYADKICAEASVSYEDPAKTEAHLYSCLEGVFTALAEVEDHAGVGQKLCSLIVGEKIVPPLDKFSLKMQFENGIS
jgi:hypothetical protein